MLRQAITNSTTVSTATKPPIFHHLPHQKGAVQSTAHDTSSLPSWSQYFDSAALVPLPGSDDAIQVYKGIPQQQDTGAGAAVFVLMHGCGLSAMSWALVAGELKKTYNVVAFDFRGHGDSKFKNSEDLNADTLVNDTILLLETLYSEMPRPPPIILVGHSMGGAIATRVAVSGKVKSVVGLAVVDVVEGTALAALGSMQGIIASRPSSFTSLHKAIEWSVSSNTVRNLESARVSIPAQLLHREEDNKWVWRTDLAKTETHWKGWFTELSKLFLQARVARMLVLAGCDRLDKELTVGQMQGKFQLVVLPNVGHLVQEDNPHATAEYLLNFATRNQFGKELVFPPKPFPTVPPKPPQPTI